MLAWKPESSFHGLKMFRSVVHASARVIAKSGSLPMGVEPIIAAVDAPILVPEITSHSKSAKSPFSMRP